MCTCMYFRRTGSKASSGSDSKITMVSTNTLAMHVCVHVRTHSKQGKGIQSSQQISKKKAEMPERDLNPRSPAYHVHVRVFCVFLICILDRVKIGTEYLGLSRLHRVNQPRASPLSLHLSPPPPLTNHTHHNVTLMSPTELGKRAGGQWTVHPH